MSNENVTMVDKIAHNNLFTVIGRGAMAVVAIMLPFVVGAIFSQSAMVNKLDTRVTVIETNQLNYTQNVGTVSLQIEELRKQNILILQAIARLEAKSDVREGQ